MVSEDLALKLNADLMGLGRGPDGRLPIKSTDHLDRLYFTSNALTGPTLASYDFRTGALIWSDETGTFCSGSPLAWGDDVVFSCHRYSDGLTGVWSLGELRIYSRAGKLLHYEGREAGGRPAQIARQVVDDKLYVSKARRSSRTHALTELNSLHAVSDAAWAGRVTRLML